MSAIQLRLEFRRDVEAFASLEAVRACFSSGVFERAPERSIVYKAFADPSGGSANSFTLAIGHYLIGKQTVVIDCLREQRPPFSPEATVEEFSNLLKSYRLASVTADRFGGEWVTEQFKRFGIRCEQAAKPKSSLYADALALINSRRIALLDHPRLISQLTALERRTGRGVRESIDHPLGGHDDVINAAAGCASLLLMKSTCNLDPWVRDDDEEDSEAAERRAYWRELGARIFDYSGGQCWPR